MMDMMVREVMSVINGPMKIIRLGSCSGSTELSPIGSMVVADSACLVTRTPDYFHSNNASKPYIISESVSSSHELTQSLFHELENDFIQEKVVIGLNASCDSFYSSQARIDSNFRDENEGLLEKIKEKHADFVSIEMETFQLFSLSKVARQKLEVSACAMVFASRLGDGFITPEKVDAMVNF